MKKYSLALAVMASMVYMLTGCTPNDDNGYGLSSYSSTGVIPEVGSYSFTLEGEFSVVDDSTTGLRSVRFSQDGFRFDLITVQNGVFFHEHGEVNGTDCPTDGYGISGHFVTTTRAEGRVVYATDCRVTSRQDFAAQR